MSRYSSDSDRAYMPMTVNAKTSDRPRDRRPFGLRELVDNNFFLDVPDAGRGRAASSPVATHPINVLIGVKRDRSRRRRRGSSPRSSSSSDSSARARHQCCRDLDVDDLPYHLRRELDFAREVKKEERRWSQKREIRTDKAWWETEFERRNEKEKRERERMEEEYEEKKRKEQQAKERIIAEAKEREETDKKAREELRKNILEEEEVRKIMEKKKDELDEKRVEAAMSQRLGEAGMDTHQSLKQSKRALD